MKLAAVPELVDTRPQAPAAARLAPRYHRTRLYSPNQNSEIIQGFGWVTDLNGYEYDERDLLRS
jgi:hypothetical protein